MRVGEEAEDEGGTRWPKIMAGSHRGSDKVSKGGWQGNLAWICEIERERRGGYG